MGKAVEQSGGHLCIAEDGGPFAEGQVGGDDDRGAFVEPADEVEEKLAAGSKKAAAIAFCENWSLASSRMRRGMAFHRGASLSIRRRWASMRLTTPPSSTKPGGP